MLEITKAPPIRISVLAAEIIYQLRSAGQKVQDKHKVMIEMHFPHSSSISA